MPSAPVISALHQLRAPVPDFVGREREIQTLVDALRAGDRVGLSGIQGLGGICKSELARVVAQRLAADYPHAQLCVDLRGTDPSPRPAADALAACIRAFVGPEAKLPEDLEELSQIYLSQLSGKRVLIVLDNAADAAQVQPLLPPPGCAVLITSREALALPGLKRLTLEELPLPEARQFLTSVASRLSDQTGEVAEEIARLCGCLPLALRAAGSLLDVTPDLDPARYAEELREERTRLAKLGAAGVDASVEASFNLSYRRLTADAGRVFRRLAVFPGSFEAKAEEAVCEDPGHTQLSELVRRSMALYDEGTARYRLHDLVRVFGDGRLEPEEREAAQRRHAGHYKTVAAGADELYLSGGDGVGRGLKWFDLEWGNIQAGQAWAAAHAGEEDGAARLCSGYPNAGAYCLALRLHPREQIEWREAALSAARRLKMRHAEGRHLGSLGNAYAALGEARRAIEFYEQDLAIAREIGDRRGEGAALGNLGLAYADLGETRRAIEFYEQALVIDREIGDRRGEGNALGNLGSAYYVLGERRRAIEFFEQALVIDREIGDRRGEGATLDNLGLAYAGLGETRRAIELYEQALVIVREIGDRPGEGIVLWNSSLALDKLGDRAGAIARAEAALQIYETIEAPTAAKVRSQLAAWGKGQSRDHQITFPANSAAASPQPLAPCFPGRSTGTVPGMIWQICHIIRRSAPDLGSKFGHQ